ncbi:S8 family peptidase [Endozoicomonas sp. SM1973]|uniref:S8 family peptidase n=1 Tax=Spartinivicinus marinus TaxID=2994442 RepID=A0A853II57_9GAMM|nr:S8 family peptidase [Spartinivicinus marinus]MCX4026369.1 S8 family peptidase [Spartinivicinus marinus]NYZ67286.1 S8 family peptidase [Spartinivicinus marinus]
MNPKKLFAVVSASLLATYGATSLADIAPATDRIIIKYKKVQSNGSSVADVNLNRPLMVAGKPLKHLRRTSTGAQVYKIGESVDLATAEKIAKELSNKSHVMYAEPDYIMTKQQVPNDSRFSEQWNYHDSTGGINLPKAWNISTGSKDVVIAVVDTGVRPHADLRANLVSGYDFISDSDNANDGSGRDSNEYDPGDAARAGECGFNSPSRDTTSSWHGTHVAGTIAATSNNGSGVSGVAWNAKILPVRVLGKCGGYTSDITDGMRWAAGFKVQGVPTNSYPAQVINLSLGGYGRCSSTYRYTIEDIVEKGVTVVVAAGNESMNAANASPGNCPDVINVAATNRDGNKSWYSNYGSKVTVAAPGGETNYRNSDNELVWEDKSQGILSTLNSGDDRPGSDNYEFYQGTSMAAPHVAGVVALMYSVNPDITPSQVKSILTDTARDFPNNSKCHSYGCGAGIIDAYAAVKKAKSLVRSTETEPGSGGTGGNCYFDTWDWRWVCI